MPDDGPSVEPTKLFSWSRISRYLGRATLCRCPVCGTRPIFIPVRQVRNFHDWLTPLDGCPVCGYAYDREPGYFLMSLWAIGYGASALVGIIIYVYLQTWHSDWSLTATLLAVAVPLPIVNVLFARHAKAYFLAIDHLFDPHLRSSEEDDDDWNGGDGRKPPTPPVSPPRGVPVREEVEPRGGGSEARRPAETVVETR